MDLNPLQSHKQINNNFLNNSSKKLITENNLTLTINNNKICISHKPKKRTKKNRELLLKQIK